MQYKKKCIFCMEFFEITGEQVVSCEYLQSIDSTELYYDYTLIHTIP